MQCNPAIPETYYTFNGSVTGSTTAPQVTTSDQNQTLEFDAAHALFDTTGTLAQGNVYRQFRLNGGYDRVADLPTSALGCFISPGLPNANPSNPCDDTNEGGFFTFQTVSVGVAPDGGLILFVLDNSGNQFTAFIRVSPANQVKTTAVTADPGWIEGTNDPVLDAYSIAVDRNNIMWVLDAYNTSVNGGNAYLAAFDLNGISGLSGPQNLAPIALIEGLTVGRFQDVADNPSGFTPFGNAISVANNRVYVANENGPTCDTNCENGTPTGEVDIYDATLRGTHDNDAQSAPLAVLYGSYVRGPIAVVDGPHGSATGTGTLLRMKQTRYESPVLAALHRRMRALHDARLARFRRNVHRRW
jgi:hypothetical protein